MNKFACKKFASEGELIDELKSFIFGRPKKQEANKTRADKFSKDISDFISTRNYSDEIKQAILDTFSHFKLI